MAKQYQNIEILRIFAAASIVFYHVAILLGYGSLGYAYSGLIIFLTISSTFLFLKDDTSKSFYHYLQKKAVRLLLPFVVWSVFYGALIAATASPDEVAVWLSPRAILAGTYYHLWYLPYLFLLTIAAFFIHRHPLGRGLKRLPMTAQLGIAVGVYGLQAVIFHYVDMALLWQQWLTSLPCFFIGLCVAQSLRKRQDVRVAIVPIIPLTFVLASLLLGWAWSDPNLDMYLTAYGLGITLFSLSFSLKLKEMRLINFMSSLTLGLYLIHPFVIVLLLKFYASAPLGIAFLLVLSLSAGVTYGLRQVPLARYVV